MSRRIYRTVTTRLPVDLLNDLERERFSRSERDGTRVSLRAVIQVALEEHLTGCAVKGGERAWRSNTNA